MGITMTKGFAFDLGDWFDDHRKKVRRYLDRYFDGGPRDQFTGRWFERFAASGDPNRFGPSDLVAVESLSVNVPSESAARLILTEADHFNDLLRQIPPDRDLWEVDRSCVESGNAADRLHAELCTLKKVGWVTAGKLIAAKRPRVIPILDKEVARVLKPPKGLFWVTMHDQLADSARRQTIAEVCDNAPPGVSLLRRIDVALWMDATQR
ncbi:DUF6308 family protein [Mycobacterium sp.]|uniref:DUF6308 family protein n=2 Tax=Mycobacterium sp. TaxID=1785 RepID=UPI003F962B06